MPQKVKKKKYEQGRKDVQKEMRKALECGRFGKLSHGSIHVRWNRNKDYYIFHFIIRF